MRLFFFRVASFGLVLLSLIATGCRIYRLERRLPPQYADFISKTRYIITRQEEKTFVELPDTEKDAFIEEFWKRRDPDPDTLENEFKTEYLSRIKTADRLFVGEGKPGWLTDRGRIYILFGPPLDRIINPMSENSAERCSEVWYYGGFPVVFRDTTCSGSYQLVTYDLSPLRELNLAYMQELNLAQGRAQTPPPKPIRREQEFFDFRLQEKTTADEPGRIEGVVSLEIPYRNIWFGEEAGRMATVIDVGVELRDETGAPAWEHREALEVTVKPEQLKKNSGGSYTRDIPFVLTENLDKLRQGINKLQVRLKNRTGGEESRKVMDIRFENH
jgi:GWxTD domain-containing protein